MIIKVEMGDGAVSKSPDIIISQGIGSCVVFTLYDAKTKIGGLAHIMMPIKTEFEKMKKTEDKKLRSLEDEKKDSTSYPLNLSTSMYQFADSAIPALLDEMIKKGASKKDVSAKIIGGARMFSSYSDIGPGIGEENIKSVKQILQRYEIPIAGFDIGSSHGRNVEFYLDTGRVVVKAFGKEDKEI